MRAHTRQWQLYRTTAIILGAATTLWLGAYWAAESIFASVAAPALSGRVQSFPHAELEVPVRSSGEHDPIRARLERLSEHEMKILYARCSQDSIERRLDGGEAMTCSIGYDVLLKKHFGGDFEQLLLWSRAATAAAR